MMKLKEQIIFEETWRKSNHWSRVISSTTYQKRCQTFWGNQLEKLSKIYPELPFSWTNPGPSWWAALRLRRLNYKLTRKLEKMKVWLYTVSFLYLSGCVEWAVSSRALLLVSFSLSRGTKLWKTFARWWPTPGWWKDQLKNITRSNRRKIC